MKKDRNWWKEKVAYQIYPRSFYDSNNDGIGDLKGITAKLDYIKDLGIDIIWLCPVYCSPMDDGGYDISDYYNINPMFGTMEDMDELINEAKKREIKILMDLVVNHCSDEHEWFKKALKDPNCEEAGYFYFKTSKNGLPNNWRSMFGGSVWEKCGETPDGDRYYLHLFSKKQPDLNWENPKLRQEIYKMINFWLKKGLGGFRVDAITHLKKDQEWKSLPVDGDDGLANPCPLARNYKGIGKFLTEMRQNTFEHYECMTVAEGAGVPYDELVDYIGDNGYFDTMFDFTYSDPYNPKANFLIAHDVGVWSFKEWRSNIFKSQIETEKIGYGALFFENHDYPRSINKFVPEKYHSFYSKTMLATLFFFMRGIPFIYQGQELGMTNTKMDRISDFDDISTKSSYRSAIKSGICEEEALKFVCKISRDNARVPFPWDKSPNGGFSTSKPWIKVHPDYKTFNAEDQVNDQNSVYSFYKKMIRIRKDKKYRNDIINGSFTPILTEFENLIAYRRGEHTAVICSFSPKEITIKTDCRINHVILSNYDKTEYGNKAILLKPFEAAVLSFDDLCK